MPELLDKVFANHRVRLLLCLLAGAATPLSFAPFSYAAVIGVSLLVLVLSWQYAETNRRALAYGWVFGFAMFCAGIYWTYISIHTTSGAPKEFAILMVIGLSIVLGLFPGLTGYFARRFNVHTGNMSVFTLPALWVLFEWIKSWLFTGFPWLSLGYSQTDTWLGGFAPVAGVYGVSWVLISAVAMVAYLIRPTLSTHETFLQQYTDKSMVARGHITLRLIILFAVGFGFNQVSWTDTDDEAKPKKVALLQGNIPQSVKWVRVVRNPTMMRYHDMVTNLWLKHPDIKLVILPEVALPGDAQDPDVAYVMKSLGRMAKAHNATLIVGANNLRTIEGESEKKRSNAVFVLGVNQGEYNKRHLVPFGEYFPVPAFVRDWLKAMNLPFNDFAAGDSDQAYPTMDGRPLGISICFEDVFGEELADALPEAGVLVNVTNDAWFGDSIARPQHLQIAQMRAKELGRYLLRSTQNGTSAIIKPDGSLQQVGESFTSEQLMQAIAKGPDRDRFKHLPRTVVIGNYHTMSGSTPYTWWENWLIAILAIIGFLSAWSYNRSLHSIRQTLTDGDE